MLAMRTTGTKLPVFSEQEESEKKNKSRDGERSIKRIGGTRL